MDFDENYIRSSFEEVQSAYWNTSMVTLHTMVVYFRSEGIDRVQSVQCYFAVSDVLNHNAVSVYTILKKLISELKMLVPDIRRIHYLTDSPTSQYRNKSIFRLISTHEEEFGVQARWNYLESGHGKGPLDGLRGQREDICRQCHQARQSQHTEYIRLLLLCTKNYGRRFK